MHDFLNDFRRCHESTLARIELMRKSDYPFVAGDRSLRQMNGEDRVATYAPTGKLPRVTCGAWGEMSFWNFQRPAGCGATGWPLTSTIPFPAT